MENKITKKSKYIQAVRFITIGFVMYLLFSSIKHINFIEPITYSLNILLYLLRILLYFLLAVIPLFIFQIKLKQKKRNVFLWLHLSFIWLILGEPITYVLFSPWSEDFLLMFFNFITNVSNVIYLLTWILLYFFINKYLYNQNIEETIELPQKDRLSFYALLIFTTVIVGELIFWTFSSSGGDYGQCISCAMATGIAFLITLAYILLIDIAIIVGFERNTLKKKSFWISLILTIIIPPILFGGLLLSSYLSDMPYQRYLYLSKHAQKYVIRGDIEGCVDYIDEYIKKGKSIANVERFKPDGKQWCLSALERYEIDLTYRTGNPDLCTTDGCFDMIARTYSDKSFCYKINESTPNPSFSPYSDYTPVLMRDACLKRFSD